MVTRRGRCRIEIYIDTEYDSIISSFFFIYMWFGSGGGGGEIAYPPYTTIPYQMWLLILPLYHPIFSTDFFFFLPIFNMSPFSWVTTAVQIQCTRIEKKRKLKTPYVKQIDMNNGWWVPTRFISRVLYDKG